MKIRPRPPRPRGGTAGGSPRRRHARTRRVGARSHRRQRRRRVRRRRRQRAGLRRQHRFRQARLDAHQRGRSATLQLNLIRSHSVGVGEPLAAEVVRLLLVLKAASSRAAPRACASRRRHAARGAQRRARAVDPEPGSVGASGDLAPLAHMTMALIGEGEFVVAGGAGRHRPFWPSTASRRSRCRPRRAWR